MKPDEILKILTKNGFDWLGVDTEKCSDFIPSKDGLFIHAYICQREGEFGEERSLVREVDYSLAQLPTNKSFLEAIELARVDNSPYRDKIIGGRYQITYYEYRKKELAIDNNDGRETRHIMEKLTYNIAYRESKDFWNIIAEYIGCE